MSKSSIKKNTLDVFVKKHGYEIVSKTRKGKWKGISKASQVTGLSRPTIYAILEAYPEPPSKTIPKYVEEWQKTEGYQAYLQKVPKSHSHFRDTMNFGLECWKLLHKKDPVSWTLEDFRKLWKYPAFYDSWWLEQGKEQISFQKACYLRKWMRVIDKGKWNDLEEFTTKGLKRPKGRHRHRFLEEPDIIALIEATDNHTLLIWERHAIESMGRSSSIELTTPAQIHMRDSSIDMFEPKTSEFVTRFYHPSTVKFIDRFIREYGIKRKGRLYPSYQWIREQLKETGRRAGIKKLAEEKVATHIMKHTGITQGAKHGIPLELLSEQSGTDPDTLKDFYLGALTRKLRHHIQGEPLESQETWFEWIERLHGVWEKKYDELALDHEHRYRFGNLNGSHNLGDITTPKFEKEGLGG